jgi:hypothetical protein
MTAYLNEIELARRVPSIFAAGGSEHVSQRYGFIPTIDVVRGLGNSGFRPVMATQSRTRIDGRESFVKHIMRFRHESALEKVGVIPEIVLVNSHDGTTSYQLRAGVFRIVCGNGLIAGAETFCRRVRHQGDVVNRVVEAANDLIEIVPISVEKAVEWKGIELKREEAVAYAQSAMALKWDGEEFPVTPDQILTPRRTADQNTDLWTAFNVVQENIVRGGIRYKTEAGSRMKTRAVNSVGENVRLNTALWTLTEKMAQLSAR